MSCKKKYTTMNTSTKASNNVCIKLDMEALMNSVTSCIYFNSMPGGNIFVCSVITCLMLFTISVALEPATCVTINMMAGRPSTLVITL